MDYDVSSDDEVNVIKRPVTPRAVSATTTTTTVNGEATETMIEHDVK